MHSTKLDISNVSKSIKEAGVKSFQVIACTVCRPLTFSMEYPKCIQLPKENTRKNKKNMDKQEKMEHELYRVFTVHGLPDIQLLYSYLVAFVSATCYRHAVGPFLPCHHSYCLITMLGLIRLRFFCSRL